jgi:3alpha(or 20beta)-hydroxysteroid dehydrogenase
MNRFTGKTVIVTGGAGALGRTMVRRFAAEGANVVIGARRERHAIALIEQLGSNSVVFARLDVTDEQQWTATVRYSEERFGPVSILVNNAGKAAVGAIESLTAEQFREVIDTNLVGTFLGTRAVVPSMRRGGGGSIVNINSIAGLGADVGLAAYGSSKWGIRGLTRIAAKELASDNIRVNGVRPGVIDTPLAYDPATGAPHVSVDNQAIPRLADVDEISTYMLFVASDDAAYSTGNEFVADGGFMLGAV